jgi:hypothetical protein
MSPTESPWLWILLCSIPAAILLALAVSRSSFRLGLGAAGCILLAAAAAIADYAVVTDREQVEQNLVGVVRAFEAGDAETTLGYFSNRAACERLLATFALEIVTVENPLSIKDIQIELQNENSIANSTVRVNGTVAIRGRSAGHNPSMWRITWRKEAEEWKIIRLQELDPLREEPLDRLARLGATVCP